MRPVLLKMEGFACYREPTTVDFRGADYFALVGPTGSGKSTVIDALTFALYGSVPRWNDQRAVGHALAPSVNRGVLQLVFEVGGQRYVVARELRRGAQLVSVRNARLERLLDPDGVADPEEQTESLAADGKVTDAVQELLGLSFENFCQCVVLPQGQFADFLRAKTSDRQKILLKLLGAERYERIMQSANSRAGFAEQEAAGFSDRLIELGDATEDAERAATEREDALRALDLAVTGLLPRLRSAAAGVAEARAGEQSLLQERARLEGLRRPPGTEERARQRSAAGQVVAGLRREVRQAEAADDAARAAAAAAPDRSQLQRALEHHREATALQKDLQRLVEAVTVAGTDHARAEQARNQAQQQVAERRVGEQLSAAEAQRAADRLAALETESGLLSGVRANAEAAALWQQYQEASRSAGTLQQELEAVEQAAAGARAAVPSAAQRARLETALGQVLRLAALAEEEATVAVAVRSALAAQQQAAGRVATVRAAAEAARADLDEAHRANLAATLRPHLHAGGRCPTCEQVVAAVPPVAVSADLDAGQDRLRLAEAAVAEALSQERRSDRDVTQAQERLASVGRQASQLREALPDGIAPQPESLAAALAEADELASGAEQAAEAASRAKLATREATRLSAALGQQVGVAWAGLRAARDPLVPLGAPALEDADLVAGWAGLVEWAAAEASLRAERLGPAREAAATTRAVADRGQAALAEAETVVARCDAAHLDATRAAQQAESAAQHARQRSADLERLLRPAPPEPEVVRLLDEVRALEEARERAGTALGTARRRLQVAEQELSELDDRLAQDWSTLRARRDALVPSGAPELPGGDLTEAWQALLTWAERHRQQLSDRLTGAQRALAGRVEGSARLRAELAALLVAADLPEPTAPDEGELARETSVEVARARERAANERAKVAQRRQQAAAATSRLRDALDRSQVARLLGDHLRSNKFQRWLAGAALDTLVLDASERLAELSGGQYELTHDRGDFFVVDHTDADSRRSVRTLSGGETFQASLALALALSSQLGTFGAGASLESILLDEGFGTLDATTLDVVATTLENLAGADRMVGVVTHVPALAERIPVRFVVRRDQRTATVVREDT